VWVGQGSQAADQVGGVGPSEVAVHSGRRREFLDNDRSWQRTAEALHVHRQAVRYRVRRVEQLTGKQVADIGDLATPWLALKAL
jgi:hypothetical protein